MTRERDVAFDLAENITRLNYEDIPAGDRLLAKMNIIDTLACTLTGPRDRVCRAVVDIMLKQGGREESTVVGYGYRLPAAPAALLNALMARAFDFDDCHEGTACHCSVSTVPVALAMAERQGRLSGRDIIASVVLANDLIARLALAANTGLGPGNRVFATSMLYGTFGAAAAAGKMLGLDCDQMVNALGIAMTRTGGTMQYVKDDGAYHINFGMLAQVGVMAALMAQRGIMFARNVFEGVYGLFQAYKGGDYRPEELTADLGKRFEGSGISIKPYPCCKHSHTSVTAVLEAMVRFNLKPDDIEEMVIRGNQSVMEMSRDRENIRFDPDNRLEARAGVEKLAGIAVVKGSITIEDMLGETFKDEKVFSRIAGVARRVRVELDPELNATYSGGKVSPSILHIRTRDGRSLTHRVDYVKGHPRNPMSLDDVIEKFRTCAPSALKKLSPEGLDEVTGLLRNLDEVGNVSRIIELIS
ncbi:MAG: MmgE/PrpD family protein [Chloroflexota bacterium]